jgi:hypothetical protein
MKEYEPLGIRTIMGPKGEAVIRPGPRHHGNCFVIWMRRWGDPISGRLVEVATEAEATKIAYDFV